MKQLLGNNFSLICFLASNTFLKKWLNYIINFQEGFLSGVANLQGVKHVILLSQVLFLLFSSYIAWHHKDNLGFVLTKLQLSVYSGKSGIQSMMKSNEKKLAEQDESVLMTSGIPYTIIRTAELQNTPGGKQGFTFDMVQTTSFIFFFLMNKTS